ncbi:MAG: hypothetical protein Kow0063_31440 [Anaerolineae bacterium]
MHCGYASLDPRKAGLSLSLASVVGPTNLRRLGKGKTPVFPFVLGFCLAAQAAFLTTMRTGVETGLMPIYI